MHVSYIMSYDIILLDRIQNTGANQFWRRKKNKTHQAIQGRENDYLFIFERS